MARRVTRRNRKTRKTRKGGALETNQQRRERERRGRPRERQAPAPRVANYQPVNYRVILPQPPQQREGAA